MIILKLRTTQICSLGLFYLFISLSFFFSFPFLLPPPSPPPLPPYSSHHSSTSSSSPLFLHIFSYFPPFSFPPPPPPPHTHTLTHTRISIPLHHTLSPSSYFSMSLLSSHYY